MSAEEDNFENISAKIAIVGMGGMGSNAINRLYNTQIKSADTIAINTDVKHLSIIHAGKKLLIGKATTRGLGAGGFPEVALKAAESSEDEIRAAIKGYDILFLVAGMGGGTGSGTIPYVAKLGKEQGSLVVAFVTYPFSLEKSRKEKANESIAELSKNADSTIIIQNDKLLSYAPNLPIDKALEAIDNIILNSVRTITDTISLPSLINLDFADLRTILSNSGTAVINIGYGSGPDKIEKAIRSNREHPLMDADIEGGKSALVQVIGGQELTIDDATRLGEGVTDGLDSKANVIFGARLSNDMQDEVKVISIVTGVTPKLSNKVDFSKPAPNGSEFLTGLYKL